MPKSSFPPSEKMGRVVRDERIAAGCRTQKDLAEKIGYFITPKSISLVESGKGGLSDAAAGKLMELFECDDVYLRGESRAKTAEFRSTINAIDRISEMQAAKDNERTERARDHDDIQSFLFDRMGWREIGYIGILVKAKGSSGIKGIDDHDRIPWVISDDDATIPEGMSFRAQYIVLESSDGRHILHIGELKKFTAMLSDFIKSGLKNLERPLMTAPGWEDFTSQHISVHPKTLLNLFDDKAKLTEFYEEWKEAVKTLEDDQEGEENDEH